jgi:NADPH2:quinone reductase
VLEVVAAALNPLDVAVSTGVFYGGHPPLPYVPGAEGVVRVRDGLAWVFGAGLGVGKDGTMADRAAVPEERLVPVPEGADPVVAAALGIAGLAGWLPLAWRVPVRPGETVLVLGATGTVGSVAVQAAKLLGAGKVVAAGRSEQGLARARELGADATVRLDEGFRDALREVVGDELSLIFDPVWGEPIVAATDVAAPGARIVHLGQSAGAEAPLVSGTVRGKQLDIHGFSDFAVPMDVLRREYGRLVGHATAGELRVDVEPVQLADVASAWSRQQAGEHKKLVLVP